MGKRKGRPAVPGRDDDKPAWAVVPAIPLEERFGSEIAQKLAALKASVRAQAETERSSENRGQRSSAGARPGAPARFNEGAGRPVGSTRRSPEDRGASEGDRADREASFAELFDPQPDDDVSFEELLRTSKLDWRKFKE
ncbi:hypothetical protein [Alicyclobacillus macrosporangiidus]|uniref:hypothetical protein n=1 Tax=Alicyclobacillus macrosporangiidus TaxID=392015 RepID=UPI0004956851|nr:hypothetical protein [Alicyclobacillus macrosporangiidus]